MDQTILIAIYAASIGTVSAGWNLRQWWMSRSQIKIRTRLALIGSEPQLWVISLTVSNNGPAAITLQEVGMTLPNGNSIPYWPGSHFGLSTKLPARIETNAEISVYFDRDQLGDKLNELQLFPKSAYARMSGDRRISANLKTQDVRKWFFGATEESKR